MSGKPSGGVATSVSDFGRLYRRRAAFGQEPIENYTSEALAIAIEHEDTPMRRALNSIVWSEPAPFVADDIARIEPRLQHHLRATGGTRMGYLDLVLDLTFTNGKPKIAWVEVKIDTGEHGDQLDVYAEHARTREPRPVIFTLSKARVRPVDRNPPGFDIGWLAWKDLVAAIEVSPGADGRWLDFLSFLEEEHVAWRSLPENLSDPRTQLGVLMDVNLRIRDRWPGVGLDYPGKDSKLLRNLALAEYERSGRLTATAGPLTYGLVPDGTEWRWSIAVGAANFQKVSLDPAGIVDQADRAGLSDAWRRTGTRYAALELDASVRSLPTREEAVDWFGAALDELSAMGVLQSFLEGAAAKSTHRNLLPGL